MIGAYGDTASSPRYDSKTRKPQLGAPHSGCEQNRNRLYGPEWLLEEWGINVDLNFGAVARPNHANNS
jgi:hypothetical protein